MEVEEFEELLLQTIQNKRNPYHPFVWINGSPDIGAGTYIGGFSEVNAKGARVVIGRGCDIASFVAINVADSHRKCIGLADANECRDIVIGDHVFIGSHSAILGGAEIGHHSVIAAGTVVRQCSIPPFSLVVGTTVKSGYYRTAFEARHGSAND
jgi:acetyltransferase-like isoleucine patch superfamily enzyme